VIGTAPVPVPFGSPEQTDCLDLVHREIAAERSNVSVVDLDKYLCPFDHCRTEVDGVELRPDAQALASSSRVSPPAAYSGPTSMEGAEPSGVTQEVATCTTSQSLPCLRWAQ
jgi:hypothetical protein